MKYAYETEKNGKAILDSSIDECVVRGNRIQGDLMLHTTRNAEQKIFYLFFSKYWEDSKIMVFGGGGVTGVSEWVIENYRNVDRKELERLRELGVKIEEAA